VTRRDIYIISVVGVVGVIAAFWLLAFSPKRSELGKANKKVDQAQQDLTSARQEASAYGVARVEFPRLYASIAKMGKAVPGDSDVPSLLVQLNHAAVQAGVDFRTVELKSGAEASPAPSPSSSSGSSTGSSGGSSGSESSGSQSGSSGGSSSGASTASSSSSSQSSAGGASASAAPANASAASSLPIGSTVGPAGFPLLQFQFKFQGSFYKMADFIHNIRRMVQSRNKQVLVSGRLVTIDGIALTSGDKGFPQVKATIGATAYLAPPGQGVFAGATPAGPSATPISSTSSSGGSGPPAAVVSAP
jgi:hypothetical protein